MPELPDLAVVADAFQAGLAGRPVTAVATPQSLVVRATAQELSALVDQRLEAVSRRGKFLVFALTRDRIVVNPMLTGRLGFGVPGTKPLTQTAVVVQFGVRAGHDGIPRARARSASRRAERSHSRAPALPRGDDEARSEAARWTAGAEWLPPADRPVELRYRDPTRMGKVYVLPAGMARPVAGWEEQGPDADDPALDLATWNARLRRHSGELKNVLRNQAFVAGIGNAYSDEILWEARLAPFRRRSTLADEEAATLFHATRTVLEWAIAELRARVPPTFEVQVRDFLRVHNKGGLPCPRCGTRLSQLSPGGFVTTFCRSCQR